MTDPIAGTGCRSRCSHSRRVKFSRGGGGGGGGDGEYRSESEKESVLELANESFGVSDSRVWPAPASGLLSWLEPAVLPHSLIFMSPFPD